MDVDPAGDVKSIEASRAEVVYRIRTELAKLESGCLAH